MQNGIPRCSYFRLLISLLVLCLILCPYLLSLHPTPNTPVGERAIKNSSVSCVLSASDVRLELKFRKQGSRQTYLFVPCISSPLFCAWVEVVPVIMSQWPFRANLNVIKGVFTPYLKFSSTLIMWEYHSALPHLKTLGGCLESSSWKSTVDTLKVTLIPHWDHVLFFPSNPIKTYRFHWDQKNQRHKWTFAMNGHLIFLDRLEAHMSGISYTLELFPFCWDWRQMWFYSFLIHSGWCWCIFEKKIASFLRNIHLSNKKCYWCQNK